MGAGSQENCHQHFLENGCIQGGLPGRPLEGSWKKRTGLVLESVRLRICQEAMTKSMVSKVCEMTHWNVEITLKISIYSSLIQKEKLFMT